MLRVRGRSGRSAIVGDGRPIGVDGVVRPRGAVRLQGRRALDREQRGHAQPGGRVGRLGVRRQAHEVGDDPGQDRAAAGEQAVLDGVDAGLVERLLVLGADRPRVGSRAAGTVGDPAAG